LLRLIHLYLKDRKICFNEVRRRKNTGIETHLGSYVSIRSKEIRAALTAIFGSSWSSVMKEAGRYTLKYGRRKALQLVTGIICGYCSSVFIILVIKPTSRILKFA